MNTGVSTVPCGVVSRPNRARLLPPSSGCRTTSNETGRPDPVSRRSPAGASRSKRIRQRDEAVHDDDRNGLDERDCWRSWHRRDLRSDPEATRAPQPARWTPMVKGRYCDQCTVGACPPANAPIAPIVGGEAGDEWLRDVQDHADDDARDLTAQQHRRQRSRWRPVRTGPACQVQTPSRNRFPASRFSGANPAPRMVSTYQHHRRADDEAHERGDGDADGQRAGLGQCVPDPALASTESVAQHAPRVVAADDPADIDDREEAAQPEHKIAGDRIDDVELKRLRLRRATALPPPPAPRRMTDRKLAMTRKTSAMAMIRTTGKTMLIVRRRIFSNSAETSLMRAAPCPAVAADWAAAARPARHPAASRAEARRRPRRRA